MPKGKIEAYCMALIESNGKLEESLTTLITDYIPHVSETNPPSFQNMSAILGTLKACIGLSHSNQVQLKGMLQEAFEKGV